MGFKERVTYYITECHLDRYDAEREALDDIRDERRQDQRKTKKIQQEEMLNIIKQMKSIIDNLSNSELHKIYFELDSINKSMEKLIDIW